MIDLRYGDCFDVMQDLIASNIKVEAVICDPPYNIKQANWDNSFNIEKAILLFKELLTPDANIILFQGWSNVAHTKEIMDSLSR